MTIGERFKKRREELKLSVPKLAARLGIESTDKIYKWEQGSNPSDFEDMKKVDDFIKNGLDNFPENKKITKINVPIDDIVTPRIIDLQATVMALAGTLFTKAQWEKFSENKISYLKELVQELVEEHPNLLEESPRLRELLKKTD